jgi:CubicO group peptidase (beta-lactamase class C family)
MTELPLTHDSLSSRCKPLRCVSLLAIAALLLACAGQRSGATQQSSDNGVYPGAQWDSITDPRTVGWSRAGLDSVRARLTALPTTGFLAIVGGLVLTSYGDLDTVTYLASVRKSILSMLMGNYVRRGIIDLDKSLADLGMDDVGGLTPQEKQATVKDLLTARSGVYHLASNPGDDLANAPPRGSQRHGTYMLYSNWDFNALGGAFEIATGRDIFDALETDLAGPIGMQDFDRALHQKSGDMTRSRYPAYHMHFSTRDMARLGYLMLRRGRWSGRQVVPADWVDESTRPFTRVFEMNPPQRRTGRWGYGYLWWVFDGAAASGAYQGAYSGQGAYGQYIFVIPRLDLVVVHKTAPDQRDAFGRIRMVSDSEIVEVIDVLIRARCGARC